MALVMVERKDGMVMPLQSQMENRVGADRSDDVIPLGFQLGDSKGLFQTGG